MSRPSPTIPEACIIGTAEHGGDDSPPRRLGPGGVDHAGQPSRAGPPPTDPPADRLGSSFEGSGLRK